MADAMAAGVADAVTPTTTARLVARRRHTDEISVISVEMDDEYHVRPGQHATVTARAFGSTAGLFSPVPIDGGRLVEVHVRAVGHGGLSHHLAVDAEIGSELTFTAAVGADDLLAAEGHTLRIWGRPMHRPANVSLYLLFRHIRNTGTTVVVGGEGADEAFAGYAWWRSTAADGFAWQDVFRESVGLLRPEFASSPRFRDYARDSHATARARVPRLSTDSPDDRRAREISWMTYTFYLDYLLQRVDRMSMAAGVEARVPFCDHELVQYAWNVPWGLKNHGGIEKGILRMAIADLLPNEVTYRRKSGYPMAQTASYQRAQYDAARAVLADRHAPVWQIVDPSAVADIVGRSGVANNSDWTDLNRIAYVLETDSWLRDLRVRVL